MHILTSFVCGTGLGIALVAAANVTVDNTSPLVVFSPTPCYQQDTPSCSPEWQLAESAGSFNGSTTSTTGPDPAHNLNVLPRASLSFQGAAVIFMPGPDSSAQASVVIDDLASILLDTSQNAFSGTGLDPTTNHTITITFVPSSNTTNLDVDYFVIDVPNSNSTSSLVPTPLPTSLPPTSTPPTSITVSRTPKHAPTSNQSDHSSGVPTGTVAAVALSGALLVVLSALIWFYTARRRRRRAALQREKAILYDLRLPSERNGKDRSASRVRRWGEEQRQREREREMESEQPWEDTPRREKGKGRETNWRDSILPPVHYTPWR